jgi:uncharacterized repeat protein (TIGR02543 family)
MQYLRFLVACLSMLACLGVSYADARLGPKPGNREGTRLKVEVCVPNGSPENCGPREKANAANQQLRVSYPPYTKRAGVVKATRLKIKCPSACSATLAGARTVTLEADATKDPTRGSYEFVEWTSKCAGQGETCTFHIAKNANVTVSAVFRSYSPATLVP